MRPPFLQSLLEAWQLSLAEGGWRALLPTHILACAAAGGAVAYYMPASFWATANQSTALTALGAILTFNGLILALCWSAFSKIYEIIGSGSFCAFLRAKKLLSQYFVAVEYTHLTQIAAILTAMLAIATDLLPFTTLSARIALGVSISCTLYAVKQSYSASTTMHDLIWQKGTFETAPRQQSVPMHNVN